MKWNRHAGKTIDPKVSTYERRIFVNSERSQRFETPHTILSFEAIEMKTEKWENMAMSVVRWASFDVHRYRWCSIADDQQHHRQWPKQSSVSPWVTRENTYLVMVSFLSNPNQIWALQNDDSRVTIWSFLFHALPCIRSGISNWVWFFLSSFFLFWVSNFEGANMSNYWLVRLNLEDFSRANQLAHTTSD